MRKLGLIAFLIMLSAASFAQTKKDTTTADIKKEAMQMRETVNKYLADKLQTEQEKTVGGPLDAKTAAFLDSIAKVLTNQQLQLNSLTTDFKAMEQKVDKVTKRVEKAATNNGPVTGVTKLSETVLVLYFPFDGHQLTPYQIAALNKFIGKKKYRSITIKAYTDWNGTEKHNSSLSNRRGQEVRRTMEVTTAKIKNEYYTNCDSVNEFGEKQSYLCRKVEVVLNL